MKGGPKKVKVSYQITKRDNEFPPTLQPELASHDKVLKGTNEVNLQICKNGSLVVWFDRITMLPQTHMRTDHKQHTTRELRPYLPMVEVRLTSCVVLLKPNNSYIKTY